MADKYRQVAEDLREPALELRKLIPDVYSAYSHLHSAALASGALTRKAKELIALSVSVVNRCDGCIANHARALAREGATSEEVAEAIGIAIMLSGGPGTVYGPRAFEAFLEFHNERTNS